MKPGISAGLSLCAQLCCGALLLAGCAQTPVKPAATHLRAPPPSAEGQIPPPVQVAPLLPKPRPAGRVET
ncbi:MAG TPA: hypothetical protein VGO02_10030, partial [Burkholderiales bacterium]|nr:hypothetical protein [Burkholderiales bacterium]